MGKGEHHDVRTDWLQVAHRIGRVAGLVLRRSLSATGDDIVRIVRLVDLCLDFVDVLYVALVTRIAQT